MKKRVRDADLCIGTRIKIRRMELGLSQENVGEQVGVTFQQIQKYENGANRIAGSRMAAIADCLEVPVGYFYEGVTKRSEPVSSMLQDRQVVKMAEEFSRLPSNLRMLVLNLTRGLNE